MESSSISPEFSTTAADLDVERSWYLLTVLLRIGQPCRPEEISANCSLFCISPEAVIRCCFVRDSPLSLTTNWFVVPSWIATSALGNFMMKVESSCVWPSFVRVISPLNGRKRLWDEVVKTYSRKRRTFIVRAPKRVVLHSGNTMLDNFSEEQIQKDANGPLHLYSYFGNDLIPAAPKILQSVNAVQKELFSVPDDEFPVNSQSHNIEEARLTLSRLCDSQVVSSSVTMDYSNHVESTTGKANVIEAVHAVTIQPMPVQLPIRECCKLKNTTRDIKSSHTVSEGRLRECEKDEAACLTTTMQVTGLEIDSACLHISPTSISIECNNAPTILEEVADTSENRVRSPMHCGMSCGEVKNEYAETSLFALEAKKGCNDTQTIPEIPDSLDGNPEETSKLKCNDSETVAEIPDSFDGHLEGSIGWAAACISRKLHGHCKEIIGSFGQLENVAHESWLPKNEIMHLELAGDENKPSEPPGSMLPLIQREADGQMNIMEGRHKEPLCKEVQLQPELLGENNVTSPFKLGQIKQDEKYCFSKKQKRSRKASIPVKNNGPDATQKAAKSHLEPKALPSFEAFVVEEEEGSGGYGTVYRARRKHDGKIFAIKCPHMNAHVHHVNNELQMLERFGGRNFVIKYEGSFKSGNSECLILEYVEHDRPEVLKKEIDMFELQWYGYCMFRALASLHKQGIVHRDVKPGNFLFSRRLNKGYLIDFNLAQDLHQKLSTSRNSKLSSDGKLRSVHHPPNIKEVPTVTVSSVVSGKSLETISSLGGSTKENSLFKETNKVKQIHSSQRKIFLDLCNNSRYRSQGADLSGVTPTREGTSAKTPSAERMRQPLPCQGRKELINLVQEAMQGPHHELTTVPSSQRKRIPAPIGKMDRGLPFLTPMPMHSNGFAVSGTAPLKSKGDRKQKREGPCVGTKGFRAPEVLFKSLHQGYKVDIWSAGVTLLYLMIGKAPFIGDPEQNIKDIAKLRGSEELWELAKLHNRDSSFPRELLDIRAVPSMKLQKWCELNGRRPDFLKLMSASLFDLIDKCLTVNPRLRIDAEEALEHEFFAPCREALRKNRIRRRGLVSKGTISSSNSINC